MVTGQAPKCTIIWPFPADFCKIYGSFAAQMIGIGFYDLFL